MNAGLVLDRIVTPDAADAPDAADFRAAIDIRNRVGVEVVGDDWVQVTPDQALPLWLDQSDEEIHGWVVRLDGEIVGRALMYVPREAGSRRAQLRIDLLRDWHGRGVGRRVLEFLEDRARERGRPIVQSWSDHRAAPGDRIHARTGFGSLPADHTARFLRAAGFRLEQVYRISELAVPREGLSPQTAHLLADAREASIGYRYVWWQSPTPSEYLDDYAWMKSRMSTDAPSGEAATDEEVWDADRLRRMEARNAASGLTVMVGAALHVTTGRLAAFTELTSFEAPGKPADQNDTLVLSEHRGHRLGALVKCETLARARQVFPDIERIVTGNAEENRPMLAINEAMGFRPVRYAGDWQKELSEVTPTGVGVGSTGSSGSNDS